MTASKAYANALLGYGADIKVKYIVLEKFFGMLPAIFDNEYRLVDPDDEMLVDVFFRYVKSVLRNRNEYEIVAQTLVKQTFPSLDLLSLPSAQLSALADISIKRIVYKALVKIKKHARLAPGKKNFLAEILDKSFKVDTTDKFGFLSSGLNVFDSTKTLFPSSTSPWQQRFVRNLSVSYGTIPSKVNKDYDVPGRFCFEPYIKLSFKNTGDIILCCGDLLDKSETSLITAVNAIVDAGTLLNTGKKIPSLKSTSIKDVTFQLNLTKISDKTIIASPKDMEKIFASLMSLADSGQIEHNYKDILSAMLKGVFFGVRCSLDSPLNWNIKEAIAANGDQFFSQKTGYYLEMYKEAEKSASGLPGSDFFAKKVLKNREHSHIVLASTEQVYDPKKLDKAIADALAFKDIPQDFYDYLSTAEEPTQAEKLLSKLMKTKEFDAVIKSCFTLATLFNTLSVLPHIERSNVVIDMLRTKGAFVGMDETLNAMFSSLLTYLSGEFPWTAKDCGDLFKK